MYKSKSGKLLFHFFKERENIFLQHLERLNIRLDEEDIHNLRRAGKRIKALYLLFQKIDPDFNFEKRFRPIKNIFNNAGALREIQVNIKTLTSYKPSDELLNVYETFVENIRQVLRCQLIDSLEAYKPEKNEKSINKVKKLCKDVEHLSIIEASKSLLDSNLGQIKELLHPNIREEEVHEVRISLKRISPVVNLLGSLKVFDTTKEFLNIKTAEDKMGYWHDRVVMNTSVQQLEKGNKITEQIQTEYNWLKNQLATENLSFIESLNPLIRPAIISTEELCRKLNQMFSGNS